MATKASINQQKYDSTHTRLFRIKLNLKIDADIIEKLTAQPSMQGYIKQLIREDIARTGFTSDSETIADEIIRTCF